MGISIYFAVIPGTIGAVVILVLAVLAGRQPPHHLGTWITGMVLLGISVLFHTAVAVGGSVNGSVMGALPVIIGTSSLAIGLIAAVWRPAWVGWMFIGTAITLPALVWLAQMTVATGDTEGFPALAMLMTYGVPSLIIGGLLVLSALDEALFTNEAGSGRAKTYHGLDDAEHEERDQGHHPVTRHR